MEREIAKVVEVSIDDIIVPAGRYRKEFNDAKINSLAESIRHVGQQTPITLRRSSSGSLSLIAGERRLRAHRVLSKPTIHAIIKEEDDVKDDIRHKILEITENLEREDFTWQEKVAATQDLHDMLSSTNSSWSGRKTAETIGLSVGGVATDLNLAKALKEDPEMFKDCKTRDAALKMLKKYELEEAMAELKLRRSKTDYGKKASRIIYNGDCTTLVHALPNASIDCIISDPAYGLAINDVKKNVTDIYDDDPKEFLLTIKKFINGVEPKLKPNAALVMFCRIEYFYTLRKMWEEIGFSVDSIPGIWHRTGSQGQTLQPLKNFARSYEVFLYGTRGDRHIQKPGYSNVFAFPGVNRNTKVHEVQKPFALMYELIQRMCSQGDTVLDFMAGSGTTLIAAIKSNCTPVGFELDKNNYNTALVRVADAMKFKDGGMTDDIGRGC